MLSPFGRYRPARLVYNYFRDYDPSTGRYIQSDPIGLAGGLNKFAYVDGNPMIYLDRYGLERSIGEAIYKAIKDKIKDLAVKEATGKVFKYADDGIKANPLGAGAALLFHSPKLGCEYPDADCDESPAPPEQPKPEPPAPQEPSKPKEPPC